MVSFKSFQTFLFWVQVVLGVWQVIKRTPVGVFVRALLWSVAHGRPPFVRGNMLVVGVSNAVYATTNNESHASFKKGRFSVEYEYAHLGHLAHISIGSEKRTYHFEEPELYDYLVRHLQQLAEDGRSCYMDEGIFVFGISKLRPLTRIELCEAVLVGRKNCIDPVDGKTGIMVDEPAGAKAQSDYFLQMLSLFNIAASTKLTVLTAFTTLLYVVLDRWHWAYKRVLSLIKRITIPLTRQLLSRIPPAAKLKIYLSLEPYFPSLQPSNFVSLEAAKGGRISGEFIYLPNNRFDGFKQGTVLNAHDTHHELNDTNGAVASSTGSCGLFKYEVLATREEDTGLWQTRVRFFFCDIVTIERMYRWPQLKGRVLSMLLKKVCEVKVGPISSIKKGVAHVCKTTELLDYLENKSAWVHYVGLIQVSNVSLD